MVRWLWQIGVRTWIYPVVVGVLHWRGIRAFQMLGFSRFPIREYGMNYDSQPLQTHEIESMKADPTIIERVIKSYQLMLDFYGMHLVSKESGLVDRVLPPRYFAPRYRNLVREWEWPQHSSVLIWQGRHIFLHKVHRTTTCVFPEFSNVYRRWDWNISVLDSCCMFWMNRANHMS